MPRTRPPYPAEYRQRILELARKGRTAWSLSQEFEPTAATIRSWIIQAGIDDAVFEGGVDSDDTTELAQLRREVAVLREEKEILAKAAAWFAEETARTPRGRSSS